jgi:hypothetical protein
VHYHIRWSKKIGTNLDWECFITVEEATDAAKLLVLPGESYSIEQVDGDCPRCTEIMKRRASKMGEPNQVA